MPDQATCLNCRAPVHLAESPLTGWTITTDDPANLDRTHLCTSGTRVALIAVDGASARAEGLNGVAIGEFGDFLAIAVPDVAKDLASRGIRVLVSGWVI